MELYLEQYLDLLINTKDIEVIKQFLPSITLDKTDEILNEIQKKLKEELKLSIEYNDLEYQDHLTKVLDLIENIKEKEEEPEISKLPENMLIFGPNFMKSVKDLEDSENYKSILTAIENLKNKEWMKNNSNNTIKYKRLHGVAHGLSEIKVYPLRLLHTKMNEDFWYVPEVMDKEGNNTKKQQEKLKRLCDFSKIEVKTILDNCKVEGKINYDLLTQYSEQSKKGIIEELKKWENRNEKR